jgi:peptide/nickel transport system substrate-binding protein
MQAGSANPWFPNVYEALFAYDPAQLQSGKYVPIPWLAQSFSLSPDGLTATIALRQGIKFHTGNTMTSTDVKYSLNRYLFFNNYPSSVTTAVGGGTQYRSYYASITNVSTSGPNTVIIHLAHPDPLLPDELASEMLYIMDSTVTESHAVTTSNSSDHGFDWLNNHGGDVGTGPFTITSETLESRIQLSKFANYWGGTQSVNTPINSIIYIAYADATAARFALEKGTVNMLIDATDQETSALSSEAGFSTIHAPGGLWMNLQMHPVGPLADWRVREAIKLAIDYKGIISSLSYGLDYASQSLFAIGMQGWTNASANYFSRQAPNITGAKKLLAEAGYPNGFTINLYTRPSSRFGITFTDFSVILQSDLAAIGINLVIETYVVGQFYNYEYELSLPGMWTQPSSLLLWGPNWESVLPGTSGNALSIGWNSSTEKGPGVNFTLMNSLYQKSQSETNTTKRIAEEQQLDTYFIQYGPYLPVIEMSDKIVYVNTITGLLWNAVGDNFVLTPQLSSP